MDLYLSLPEVIAKCTQALRALQIPPGLDIENGKNIGWLAANGLPGLELLYEEIETASKPLIRLPIIKHVKNDCVVFSSQKHSAFYITQSAVDFAENGMNVSIKNCYFPLLIFAEMARREHLPFGFKIQWVENNKCNTGLSKLGRAEISSGPGNSSYSCDVKITAVDDVIIKNPLKTSFENNGDRGASIRFNSDHWRVICSMAENVLVPDSKQSHSSAGGEVDDSK